MKIRQEILSSRNNPLVKWAASLVDKKARNQARSFFVEGEKLALEAIKNRLPISYIFVTESKYERSPSSRIPGIVLYDTRTDAFSTGTIPPAVVTDTFIIAYSSVFVCIENLPKTS